MDAYFSSSTGADFNDSFIAKMLFWVDLQENIQVPFSDKTLLENYQINLY